MDPNRLDPKRHPVGRSVACYFCNEFVEDSNLKGHVIQCGAVLDPCPKKCGAYIQRSNIERHVMECRFRKPRKKNNHDILEYRSNTIPDNTNNLVSNLQMQIMNLQTTLAEEKKQHFQREVEIKELNKLFKKTEEYSKQLGVSVVQLQKVKLEDNKKMLSNGSASSQGIEMEKINLQYQVLESWKKQIDSTVEFLKARFSENENKVLDAEYVIKNIKSRLEILDNIEIEMNMLRQRVGEDQFNRQEESISWRGELNEFKEFFNEENIMIAAVWNEQREDVAVLKKSLEIQATSLQDFKTKYQAITFDTKSVTQISNESAERLESLRDEFRTVKNNVEQLKLDFKLLQEEVTSNYSSLPTGRLMWKIDDFKNKMASSKNHNTVIRSPIFTTSSYGYKIRLEIYLNGIKKWKGRHIIISVQVLKGEWDPVLTWPCHIEAVILLRDLNDKENKIRTQISSVNFFIIKSVLCKLYFLTFQESEAILTLKSSPYAKSLPRYFLERGYWEDKSIKKYIAAKRLIGDEENEDPQESSTQYIFITHSSLEKQTFIKDNTMYLETIIITDNCTINTKK